MYVCCNVLLHSQSQQTQSSSTCPITYSTTHLSSSFYNHILNNPLVLFTSPITYSTTHSSSSFSHYILNNLLVLLLLPSHSQQPTRPLSFSDLIPNSPLVPFPSPISYSTTHLTFSFTKNSQPECRLKLHYLLCTSSFFLIRTALSLLMYRKKSK